MNTNSEKQQWVTPQLQSLDVKETLSHPNYLPFEATGFGGPNGNDPAS